MSFSLSRALAARVVGILTCGFTLVGPGGCVHSVPVSDEDSAAERATFGNGQRANNQQALPYLPGVVVIRTLTGGFSMRILSGLVGAGEPLYVIDDIRAVVEPSRGIDWFKPEDIVRIRVLKDPAETTVYGPAGANGVILITTKEAMRRRKGTTPPL
jgi:TonB-dependent SusC/RagA subfamily outer membrane receptor